MKRPDSGKLQDIVFTGILAVAVVVIYVLSGRNLRMAEAAVTPEPTSAPEQAGFAPVPEAVFVDLITGNGEFSATARPEEERTFDLLCGKRETGSAVLSYTLSGQEISSVMLTIPRRDPPPAKPKTEIEQALADSYPAYIAAQNEALRTMLSMVISACDLNDVLIAPIIMKWYSGALTARDEEKEYEDTYLKCTFLAYPSQIAGESVVVCSLLTP